MQAEGVDTPELLAERYLDQLGGLAEELESAMGAISANALPRLQDSVRRQEFLCASLVASAASLDPRTRGAISGAEASPDDRADTALSERVRLATASLQQLNLRYAALLKHSSHSMSLFAGLCRSYSGALSPPARQSSRPSWSCEL